MNGESRHFVLPDSSGAPVARSELLSLGAHMAAIRLTWLPGAMGVPDAGPWRDAIASHAAECRARGVRVIETRVVTDEIAAGPDGAARAAAHRERCREAGFRQGDRRHEFLVPLADALAALAGTGAGARLEWRCVATTPGAELQRAAALLAAVAVGDPDADPDDDALGFLLSRRDDADARITPESLQVGSVDGVDAAIVAPTVWPVTRTGSLTYLGVLPEFRGRGLGDEAMRHGLQALHDMGAFRYHDGTSSRNAPALALFRRIAARPSRVQEQWRLEL
jgi:ribosomal protein S18 acetylase RimI-like enzyme